MGSNSSGSECKIHLPFNSVDDFVKELEENEAEKGFFVKSISTLVVGQQVSIVASIKGTKNPVFLEGMVLEQPLRLAGQMSPSDVFIGLVEHDRTRLDSIFKYLKTESKIEHRAHPRYPISMPSAYYASMGAFSSQVKNLSVGGAFIKCDGPLFSIGTHSSLQIFVEGDRVKGLTLKTKVAWIDNSEDAKGMGLAFIAKQPQLETIKFLVEKYERELRKRKPAR
ncbi:MAG: PilZ domain-containing protein [Deltaproteobacteria bacterium]|nr:PilZ domain-containing protein [Deltaproteobacteria bacterium]